MTFAVQQSLIFLGIGVFLGLISPIWDHILFSVPSEFILC